MALKSTLKFGFPEWGLRGFSSDVLVINCGSSSIKFSTINPATEAVLLKGQVKNLGDPKAAISYERGSSRQEDVFSLEACSYQEIFYHVGRICAESPFKAIGHRIVHGGPYYHKATLLDNKVLARIQEVANFAPLHNPLSSQCVEHMSKQFPGVPQIGVFDTAFHQTLPEYAYRYAIPEDWYQEHSIRKYGFHGTSHKFVANQAALILDRPLADLKMVTAHLGHGCSVSAIRNGQSVDTSMGITPLEGLMMGTRSGDLDPAVLGIMGPKLGLALDQMLAILNQDSGLKGTGGGSGDFLDLETRAVQGDPRAQLAMDMFGYRLAKYIASYLVPLGGIDVLVFTGGIGERSPLMRANTLQWLSGLGFAVDAVQNAEHGAQTQGIISHERLHPVTMVIPTQEELLIAQETAGLLALTHNRE